jgi:hypothetical protein
MAYKINILDFGENFNQSVDSLIDCLELNMLILRGEFNQDINKLSSSTITILYLSEMYNNVITESINRIAFGIFV